MPAALARIALIAVLFVAARPATANFVYTFNDYPAHQNGYTLAGTITTSKNTGLLTAADFTAWSFTLTPTTGAVVSLSSATPGTAVQIVGSVAVSPTAITIGAAGGPSTLNQLSFLDPVGFGYLNYVRRSPGEVNVYLALVNPQTLAWSSLPPDDGLGGDPWVIAGAAAAAVPAPGGLTLLALAGVTLAARRVVRRAGRAGSAA